jgi:amidophosphoribosyltransferase
VEGTSVYEVRKRIGAELAAEAPAFADIVVPVPDSGVPAAIGFAEAGGLPFDFGIIRNHYVGRTFIEPTDAIRHMGVKLKHNANSAVLKGKRVVLVDDSIVRGTTSYKIVQMVRDAGASEVHMRSPPRRPPTPASMASTRRKNRSCWPPACPSMKCAISSVSTASLSSPSMAFTGPSGRSAGTTLSPQYCDACFTGAYPTRLTDQDNVGEVRHLSLFADTA